MKKIFEDNKTPLSILAGAVLISLAIVYITIPSKFNLDAIEKVFSIIGSLSILIALATYYYTQSQDWNTAAIDQISFLRKEVIPQHDEVASITKQYFPQYLFPLINIKVPTAEFMREHFVDAARQQLEVVGYQKDGKAPIFIEQIKLFNCLEEFALKVLHYKTQDHEALNSAKSAFVLSIEQNAAALVFEREVIVGNNVYPATLALYNIWEGEVERVSVPERLAAFQRSIYS